MRLASKSTKSRMKNTRILPISYVLCLVACCLLHCILDTGILDTGTGYSGGTTACENRLERTETAETEQNVLVLAATTAAIGKRTELKFN